MDRLRPSTKLSPKTGRSKREPGLWRRALGGGRNLRRELALLSPLFALYHAGVAFLPVRNATDWVTAPLLALAEYQRGAYVALSLGLAALYLACSALIDRERSALGRDLLRVLAEGTLHAVLLRVAAGALVGRLGLSGAGDLGGPAALVMSAGAGLYEELVFRGLLFSAVGRVVIRRAPRGAVASEERVRAILGWWLWALATAVLFSAWHHVGALGEPFTVHAFVFRVICGVFFCGLFVLRGLATTAWAHALYDVGVLAL